MNRLINSIIIFLLVGCNPVKSVMNDKDKLDMVAREVVKMGYCANDTVIVTKTVDSIVYKDVIVDRVLNIPCKDFDTLISGCRIKVSSGVLSFKKKDSLIYRTKTITNTVVDRAMENILKSDIDARDSAIISLGKEIDELNDLNDQIVSKMNGWKIKFFGMILLIVAWNVFKRWVKSKIYGPI